jgi:hypothetical protein
MTTSEAHIVKASMAATAAIKARLKIGFLRMGTLSSARAISAGSM